MTVLLSSIPFIVILASANAAENSPLAQALVSIINRSYLDKTKVFSFYIKCAEDVHRIRHFTDLMDSTVRQLDSIAVRIGVHEELPADSDQHYCILAVDSAASLKLLYNEVRSRHFNIMGRVLIVLETFEEQHYYDALLYIFEGSWRTGIVDVNVVVEPIPSLILMFTFYPYSVYSCNAVMPVITNRYTDSKWEVDEFFPFKLGNLHGCPLICATWEEEPYLKIFYDDDGSQILSGIEGKLLDFIATRMNFTARLYIMEDEEIDATLDSQGLVFDKLFKDGIDFAIGAFHYKPTQPDDFFTPSRVYYLSNIVIVLSSRRESISPIKKLLLPFRLAVWLCTLLFFGTGVLIVLNARRLKSAQRDFVLGSMNQIPVYNMFTTALGSGVYRTPRRNFARFLLCLWMLLWLVLRSGYQSALFHIMKSDISVPPPDNIEDVLKEGYEVLLTPTVYNTVTSLPLIQAASKFLNGSEVENFPMLSKVKKKIAILTPYEYFGYFRKRNLNRTGEFYVAKKDVFIQPLSAYFKKDSYLVSSIDSKMLECASIGLIQKWHNNFVEVQTRNIERQSFKTLTFAQIAGLIEIYLLGVFVSLLGFAVELGIHNFSRLVK